MNKINLTFLGTSSMMPTKTRGQSGIFIDCGTEKILFDCGENIQRQMRIAGISSSKITRIFISHWHGDHVFGLPGLLENIGKNSANPKIEIYGTKEVGLKINSLIKTFDLKDKIKIKFNKIEENGIFFEDEKLKFGAYLLNHSTPCLGYFILEKDKICIDKSKLKKLKVPNGPIVANLKLKKNIKINNRTIKWKDVTYMRCGKKVGFLVDTAKCSNALKIAKNADLFVCESTFSADMEFKAKKYKHLTSAHAGEIASKANVNKLVLTHFSQRYDKKNLKNLKKEAEMSFDKKVIIAEDFMKLSV